MQVAFSSVYLGFAVGPRKGDSSWTKPAAKFMERVYLWRQLHLGLQFDAMVYNTFGMSTLAYICQLESPPPWVLEREEETLRIVAPGPGNWATPDDLWRLKESFGLAKSFTSLQVMSRSAQQRVWCLDRTRQQGAGFRRRANILHEAVATPDQLGAKRLWGNWYKRSFLLCLVTTSGL